MTRKPSDLTVTDQFCGAGGSSLGAAAAGARLRMALNHWELAIETHNTNFPQADHDCTDISVCDPRRYPSTDILISSPECTNHSLAKGARRKALDQVDLFRRRPPRPEDERSRATMWDVPRFAEFHDYNLVIVENVVDARRWVMFDAWLLAMHSLGYRHRCLYLNSMFCHPTPQSRDRLYVVFWKKGNPAPDLELRPPAWCRQCEQGIEAVQSWKPERSWGRFRRQYLYCCPSCGKEVEPYYYAALNAIDWSIESPRIGDRSRPLAARTIERIEYGLRKYGREPLQIITNQTNRVGGRVRGGVDPGYTQTGSALTALVHPSFLTSVNYFDDRNLPLDQPLGTQTTQSKFAFVTTLRGTAKRQLPSTAVPLDDPIGTISAGGIHHALVTGAALMTLRAHPAFLFRELSAPLATQVASAAQDAIISRRPFLVQYNRSGAARDPAEAMATVTTRDRIGVVGAEPRIEDCHFRMLQPHEIGRGMAFPECYEVLGNKRERVKQYGNAVTPPVMEFLCRRAIESLTGEELAGRAKPKPMLERMS